MGDNRLVCDGLKRVFSELGDSSIGALATCHHNHPFVRSVSCIFLNGLIYFQTDKTMAKAEHIRENCNVALCFRHIQINGTCEEIGPPMLPNNAELYSLFKRCYPAAAENYSMLKAERLYKVTPSHIEVWRYLDGKPYIEYIDYETNLYSLQEYSP